MTTTTDYHCWSAAAASSDYERLTWEQLLSGTRFSIIEKKTGKRRDIKINAAFQQHIRKCYDALGILHNDEFCFLNSTGTVISTQMINRHLKAIKQRYNLDLSSRYLKAVERYKREKALNLSK